MSVVQVTTAQISISGKPASENQQMMAIFAL